MKILTANIAFGLEHMDRLLPTLTGHLAFHGGAMLRLFLHPRSLKKTHAYSRSPRRVRYLNRHINLRNTLSLIEKEHADVVVLNEVLLQFHRETLEPLFARLGYLTVVWGAGTHYPDATVTTVVASKIAGVPVPVDLSSEGHAGGGAGVAAIRFEDSPVTVIGLHLGMADKFPWLYDAEIQALAGFISKEQALGRGVVVAGDWNASSAFIQRYPSFVCLNLANADLDTPTCPTFLPWLKPLDHVFVPRGWTSRDVRAIPFGSDHLALSVEANPT